MKWHEENGDAACLLFVSERIRNECKCGLMSSQLDVSSCVDGQGCLRGMLGIAGLALEASWVTIRMLRRGCTDHSVKAGTEICREPVGRV